MREIAFCNVVQGRATTHITSSLYDRKALDVPPSTALVSSLSHLVLLTSTSARIREIVTTDGALERLCRILIWSLDGLTRHSPVVEPAKQIELSSFLQDVVEDLDNDIIDFRPRRRVRTGPRKPFAEYFSDPSILQDSAYQSELDADDSLPILNPHIARLDGERRQKIIIRNLTMQCIINIGVRGSEHIRIRLVEAGVLPAVVLVLESYLLVHEHVLTEEIAMAQRKSDEIDKAATEEIQAYEELLDAHFNNNRQPGRVDAPVDEIREEPVFALVRTQEGSDPQYLELPARTVTPESLSPSADETEGDDDENDSLNDDNDSDYSSGSSRRRRGDLRIVKVPAGLVNQEAEMMEISGDDTGLQGGSEDVQMDIDEIVAHVDQLESQIHDLRSLASRDLVRVSTITGRERRSLGMDIPTSTQRERAADVEATPTISCLSHAAGSKECGGRTKSKKRSTSGKSKDRQGEEPSSIPPIYGNPDDPLHTREEDILMSLQLLAYLSKYPHVRTAFHRPDDVPVLNKAGCSDTSTGPSVSPDVSSVAPASEPHNHRHSSSSGRQARSESRHDAQQGSSASGALPAPHTNPERSTHEPDSPSDEWPPLFATSWVKPGPRMPHPTTTKATERKPPAPFNVFSIVERFTHRAATSSSQSSQSKCRFPPHIQYWAGVIMRNACRKDESRGGIRQCANMQCGAWETFPREFAKCRRCRKAKYCSKTCQSKAWAFGHKFWCSSKDGEVAAAAHAAMSSRPSAGDNAVVAVADAQGENVVDGVMNLAGLEVENQTEEQPNENETAVDRIVTSAAGGLRTAETRTTSDAFRDGVDATLYRSSSSRRMFLPQAHTPVHLVIEAQLQNMEMEMDSNGDVAMT